MTWKLGADDPDLAVEVMERYEQANAEAVPEAPVKKPRSAILSVITVVVFIAAAFFVAAAFLHLLWRIAIYGWRL